MTVGELLARVSSRELTEWEAYERVAGPVGDERFDHLFSMLQATIANVNRGKNQKAHEPSAFLPKWGVAKPDPGPMSGHDMLEAVKRLNKRMGGTQSVNAG
ncbi:MAG: hypothetical protein ABW022_23615 [Actinoplanes sp.]